MTRTRFAPSPTGYLHLGGARTALFSWAYARKHGGQFVLRIEDTDLERSTAASVQAIFDGMTWLGIDYDEGPFFQMQRMPRYKEVIQQLLDAGQAYYCYATKEELDALRARQTEAGIKPRYDGRWRDSTATPPAGVPPVVRFRNPVDGVVVIDDLIKGRVTIANSELDDFIIARSDGTPTYNFCVVIDDWDMNITHVIRGDDHLNNTPRQINVLRALDAPLPQYAHLPMILNKEGAKMSKRQDAVSVMQYAEAGYLPEAMLNYLARLGWGHENDEIFSMPQFIEWFDVQTVSPSAARFDPEKLNWLNQQYMKAMAPAELAQRAQPYFVQAGIDPTAGPALAAVVELMRERTTTLAELAGASRYFYATPEKADAEAWARHYPEAARPMLAALLQRLADIHWTQDALQALLQETVKAHGVKFAQLAMPLRLMICGTPQTPSIDAVLALLGRDTVLARMRPFVA